MENKPQILEYKVFEHGYVKYIEHYGSDERIVESARMSTGKGFLGWGPIDTGKDCPDCYDMLPVCSYQYNEKKWCVNGRLYRQGDEKLLKYLWLKQHSSPFEQAGITLEVQAPIFVIRQWFRHRTQRVNEFSGRYAEMPSTRYTPTLERCMLVDTHNNQANALETAPVLTETAALEWLTELECAYAICEQTYQSGLKRGISKELARIVLPLSQTTRMRTSVDLSNLLKFLKLRLAKDAQSEIVEYTKIVGKFVAKLFPRTWALFCETYSIPH